MKNTNCCALLLVDSRHKVQARQHSHSQARKQRTELCTEDPGSFLKRSPSLATTTQQLDRVFLLQSRAYYLSLTGGNYFLS